MRALITRVARAALVALIGLVAPASGGCASEDAAPERRCAGHAACDDGFLCGDDGLCRPAVACERDEQCCPGAVCFSGWCRPTAECVVGESCPGLGEVCEARPGLGIAGAPGALGDTASAGLCVPAPCDPLGGCAEPFSCVGGRCVIGSPCGGRCGPAEVCDVASARCLPAPPGCACGERLALAAVGAQSPFSCGVETYGCACVDRPEVPAGHAGVDGRLVTGPSGLPAMVSYEPDYGDLVLSRFLDAAGRTAAREDVVLDGVPLGAVTAAGYRGGVLDPGPDRGARPAVALGEGGGFDVLYRDLDRQRVMFSRFGPDGARQAIGELPIEGREVGRYSCLARRGDGRLAGLIFVSADPSDTVSLLVRVEAGVIDPVAADQWSATTVVETPLPPRAERPCADACGLSEACVLAGGVERCAAVLDLGGLGQASPCGTCGPREICAELDGARACRARVYRRYDADRLPFGEGLFASCTARGQDVYAAWYDADRRRLVAARWPFSAADRVVVDEGAGKDPGRFASIALGGAQVGIAYQDAARGALVFAEASAWGAPFLSEDLPTGDAGSPGLGAQALYLGERPVVVHLDGRHAEVEVLARGADCWGRRAALGGGVSHPSALADAQGIWVGARALAFSESLEPRHAPALVLVAPPVCP